MFQGGIGGWGCASVLLTHWPEQRPGLRLSRVVGEPALPGPAQSDSAGKGVPAGLAGLFPSTRVNQMSASPEPGSILSSQAPLHGILSPCPATVTPKEN